MIGAGPAGLAAALFLKSHGFPATVYEAKSKGRPKVCGGLLNPNAMPLLSLLGLTDWRANVSASLMNSFLLSSRRGFRQWALPAGVHAVSRTQFDEYLWVRAVQSGVEILPNTPVKKMRVIPEGVEITTESRGTEQFAHVICADGMNSAFAETQKTFQAKSSRVGVKYLLKTQGLEEGVLGLHFHPCGYIGSCAYGSGLFDFSAIVDLDKLPRGSRKPMDIFSIFSQSDRWLIEKLRGFEFVEEPHFVARAWPTKLNLGRGRVQFAGDAARFLEPFTGLGITHALGTGILAASRIILETEPQNAALQPPVSQLAQALERALTVLIKPNLRIAPVLRYPLIGCLGANFLVCTKFPVNLVIRRLMNPVLEAP
ncbi:FAD-dependent monooxygenase [Oscillatoria laete-virens NRMC-F 0139]|nr:FAD-dependent monooxygenase [Oscillatoria laete-virens]MDL5052543.1 FAD-dependent monooxygenase [Oscillatoria laete-virens NRMC-F 0139]